MFGHHCNEEFFEENQESNVKIPLHSPVNRLEADHIYDIMTCIKNGLCMTANPINFTNKFIPSHEPLVKLRQNHSFIDVEVMCPLPIQKINVLSPSTCDELRAVVTTYFSKWPRCELAFSSNDIAKRVKEKEFIGELDSQMIDNELEKKDENYFEYKITASDLSPENYFAVNPMQVGRWFPGMYTIYPDST